MRENRTHGSEGGGTGATDPSGVMGAAIVVKPPVSQPLDVPFYPQGGEREPSNARNGKCGMASEQMLIWFYYQKNGLDAQYRQNHGNIQGAPESQLSVANIKSALRVLHKHFSDNNMAEPYAIPQNYTGYTVGDWNKTKGDPFKPVIDSILAGHPAIVYTDIYKRVKHNKKTGKDKVISPHHIFILTGYDSKTKLFHANDTFQWRDGTTPKDVTALGIRDEDGNRPNLSEATIKSHLRAQGSGQYFIYAPK